MTPRQRLFCPLTALTQAKRGTHNQGQGAEEPMKTKLALRKLRQCVLTPHESEDRGLPLTARCTEARGGRCGMGLRALEPNLPW